MFINFSGPGWPENKHKCGARDDASLFNISSEI